MKELFSSAAQERNRWRLQIKSQSRQDDVENSPPPFEAIARSSAGRGKLLGRVSRFSPVLVNRLLHLALESLSRAAVGRRSKKCQASGTKPLPRGHA